MLIIYFIPYNRKWYVTLFYLYYSSISIRFVCIKNVSFFGLSTSECRHFFCSLYIMLVYIVNVYVFVRCRYLYRV